MASYILDKRIIIEKETTTKNAVGTPTETYVFHKDTYANVKDLVGNTNYTTEGALPFSVTDFVIRYDDTINYKCRIQYEDQYYLIKHISYEGRKHWIRMKAIVWEES